MACKLCTSGEDEAREHLERCKFTEDMRKNLDLNIREDKIVLWRKITRALKDIYDPKKDVVNKYIPNQTLNTTDLIANTIDCESTPNPEGQGEALPATDRETCSRGRDGLITHVVVAISVQAMSVGALISDHPL